MVCLWSWQYALCSSKLNAAFECRNLWHCYSFYKTQSMKVADDGCHTMVAKPAGVDGRGHEGVPQGIHHDNRCHTSFVSIVPGVGALGDGGAGFGLDIDDLQVWLLACDLVLDEW